MAQRFTAVFKPLGFKYVTLDLEGYRQGSLNKVLRLGSYLSPSMAGKRIEGTAGASLGAWIATAAARKASRSAA
jgi:hypothetical protein